MTIDALAVGVRARQPRAIARALTLVTERAAAAGALLRALAPGSPRAWRVGITGAPGVGKSTLVDGLIEQYRSAGLSVAVLAVDPSSPFTGGAVLGDRVRMQRHADDAGVFIRSLATRGEPGGIPATTRGAAAIFDAAGFDVTIIETVGVGQGDVDVARLADVTVVVLMPGGGDDLQAQKAGLMEIADVFVVNKADLAGADRAMAAVQAALALGTGHRDGWTPPVLATTAAEGAGIEAVVAAIARFRETSAGRPRPRPIGETSRVAVHHVAIAAHETGPLLSFFEDALGLPAETPETIAGQSVHVQFLRAGDTALEVVVPAGAGSPVDRFLEARGPGLHHVALSVEDLEACLKALAARGIRLIDATPRVGAHGARVAFVHPSATGGVLVELVERDDRDRR